MGERRRWFGARARTRARDVPAELRAAGEAFGVALSAVERAKASLVGVVRSGRAPGAPLAEALAGFDVGLAEADAATPAWRTALLDEEWRACRAGIDQARRRAERLRLSDGAPAAYEELVGVLAELLDPLEPFEGTAVRLRRLGVRVG